MTPLRKRLWVYGSLGAFLAIVWAILAPIFAAARDKSRPATCLSHIKQLAFGQLLYREDYEATLPPAWSWASATEAYVKGRDVWKCPNAPTPYGYGYNASLDGIPTEKIGLPFETALLFEADAVRLDTYGGPERLTGDDRHTGGLMWAYADGHARWQKRGAAVRWKP